MSNELERYWQSIPVGKQYAASYARLETMWHMSERKVRLMLAELSRYDNGDNYILIRSSGNKGFYRTDDPVDIAAYKRECRSRAIKTFAPLRKINRVQRIIDAESVNCSLFNNMQGVRQAQGMSQAELCRRLRQRGIFVDVSLLSKIENGYAMPTPVQISAMADILSCEPFELVAIDRDSLEVYAPQSGLQMA